jgi:hypothetical protein
MTQNQLPQVQACAVRVALLDSDGSPSGGASASYITDALVKCTVTPVYEDGAQVTEQNACGNTYLDYRSDDTLTRGDIELDFLTPDPKLHAILISQGSVLTGAWGEGWAYPPIGTLSGQLSLELWAKRINNGILDPSFPYARWAIPLCKNMRLGAREFSNTPQHSLINGQCYENENWFDGPANDWPSSSDRIAQWIPVTSLPTIDGTYDSVTAS